MASTFMGLNISYSGLVASNAALNTTANNIANVETVGYSRQIVNQSASTAMRAFASHGCIGAGVDTLGAERVRDIYYDEKYWNNNSKLGEFDKKQYYCAIIENYLRDDRGTNEVKGFTTIFNEYHSAMDSLSNHTGETNYALEFIGKAGNLCEYFNILYNNFQKMQTDVNDEIKIKTDEINGVAQQIALLNKQINMVEANGNTVANDLRDKRDLLIDQLSAVVDVKCEERPIKDLGGDDTNINEYIVSIAGGQTLVNGYEYRQLECVPRETWQKANQNDVDGLYDVRWTDTEEDVGLSANNVRGELKGLYEMRDGNNAEAFHGKVSNVDKQNKTVTVATTDSYLKDISKSTLPLTNGQIMLSGDLYYYDSFTFETDELGNTYYTFQLSEDKSRNPVMPSGDITGKTAKIGEQVAYQGIPYYLEQMNEWVRDYAYHFNEIYGVENATDFNGNNHEGDIFFTGNNDVAGGQYNLKGVSLYATSYDSSQNNGYYMLTAGNFNVEKSIQDDASTLATHTGEGEGVSKYDIINNLKDLSTNKDKMVFRGCDAQSFLICLMGDSGLNAQSANSFQEIYSSIEESIANSRFSVSGVDSDEEAANMIKFQNAYNLASKMISVLSECYDRLITQTGV
ncbi:MAG: flagellar hook-associated protein FlgK [Lachnospiraceae bacterium]|jgi:flagellar hook-associated protein 1 FlgK|nr:flagellar hook-associated protein FlgK [Lachnospiraceae bacterium]